MQKQVGFNGGGFWAVLIGLGLLVWWIRHDFGVQMAGWVAAGMFGVLVLIVGLFLGLAYTKSVMGSVVDYEQTQASTRRLTQQADNMVLRASLGIARPLANQMAKYQIAQHNQAGQPEQAEPSYWDLDATVDSYRWDGK